MGIILFFGLAMGLVVGLTVTILLGIIAVVRARQLAPERRNAWRVFGITSAISVPVLAVVVHFLPLPEVAPGSDYDVAFKNLVIQGIAYASIPGVALVLGSLAILTLPHQASDPSAPPPPPEEDTPANPES